MHFSSMEVTLIFSTLLAQNVVLFRFLGIEGFGKMSVSWKETFLFGGVVLILVPIVALINFLVYRYFLVPFNLEHILVFVFFINVCLVCVSAAFWVEQVFSKLAKETKQFFATLPLNSLILGVSLFGVIQFEQVSSLLIWSLSAALGWFFLLILITAVRQKGNFFWAANDYQVVGMIFILFGLVSLLTFGLSGVL